MLIEELGTAENKLKTMTPRAHRKKESIAISENTSSQKFVFPTAVEKPDDGSLSKDELEKLLLERTDQLED